MPQKKMEIKRVLCLDWSHWKMWRGAHTRLNRRAWKNQNLTPNSMDKCKENQDLILIMHKKALNETLLAIIEIFNIFKVF